jgi:hypothetical protein
MSGGEGALRHRALAEGLLYYNPDRRCVQASGHKKIIFNNSGAGMV